MLAILKGQPVFSSCDLEGSILFPMICWFLWKQRNDFIFQQILGDTQVLLNSAVCMASNVVVAGSRGVSADVGRGETPKWRPLGLGWVKLNTDGAANAEGSRSVAVGVFRDSNGSWLLSFQRALGRGSTLNSELWAILLGLHVARMKGYVKVCVESDCLMVVSMIKDSINGAASETITRTIKEFLGQFEDFKVQFARREGNLVADYFAKTCESDLVDVHIIDVPSTHLRMLLSDDLLLP